MPNRILKESICYSENIEDLTWFQEVFFYRLIVNCDDYGRMDARPKVLASKLFPLRDIRLSQISDALKALSSAKLVVLYEKDGHPFLQMRTWDRHQTIRAKKSKYPSFDSDISADEINCMQMQADEINCNQMNANVPVIQSNPIRESVSVSLSESNAPGREESETDRFDRFWSAYPRKESKPAAKKAFDKIKPGDELLETMIRAIDQWKESAQWQENGGQFIPYPASWLNQRKWEDDIPAGRPAAPRQPVRLPVQDFDQRDYSDDHAAAMDRLLSWKGDV